MIVVHNDMHSHTRAVHTIACWFRFSFYVCFSLAFLCFSAILGVAVLNYLMVLN